MTEPRRFLIGDTEEVLLMEKNIALPASHAGGSYGTEIIFPWEMMESGESFFVPNTNPLVAPIAEKWSRGSYIVRAQGVIHSDFIKYKTLCKRKSGRPPTFKIATRQDKLVDVEGIRVWRIDLF